MAAQYYPVRIGKLVDSCYQIVGKLGFGGTSTVWLARDSTGCRHVAQKIYIRSANLGSELLHELLAYQRLDRGPTSHLDRRAVRTCSTHSSFPALTACAGVSCTRRWETASRPCWRATPLAGYPFPSSPSCCSKSSRLPITPKRREIYCIHSLLDLSRSNPTRERNFRYSLRFTTWLLHGVNAQNH